MLPLSHHSCCSAERPLQHALPTQNKERNTQKKETRKKAQAWTAYQGGGAWSVYSLGILQHRMICEAIIFHKQFTDIIIHK